MHAVACSHRPPCPGCPMLGRSSDGLPWVHELARFAQRNGARFEVVAGGEAVGSRHRARLAIRGRHASPKLGIFQEGSHRIVDIPRCMIHHPLINEVAQTLKAVIRETASPPYADGPHRGLLRYAQVTVDRAGERVQLVIVTNSRDERPASALLSQLPARVGPRLQGLFWNGQSERTNAIVGPRFVRIAGDPALDERIGSARVFFPPDAFSQSNPVVYEQIVEHLSAWVPDGTDVLELYAGVGAIGLSLLPRVRRVRCNELAPGSLRGLRLGIEVLPAATAARIHVLEGRAAAHAAEVDAADVVIVDPPRKGLDAELLDALCAPGQRPRSLVYLSCGPQALIAEAARLEEQWSLRELLVFDLFPWTGHVEALARFER